MASLEKIKACNVVSTECLWLLQHHEIKTKPSQSNTTNTKSPSGSPDVKDICILRNRTQPPYPTRPCRAGPVQQTEGNLRGTQQSWNMVVAACEQMRKLRHGEPDGPKQSNLRSQVPASGLSYQLGTETWHDPPGPQSLPVAISLPSHVCRPILVAANVPATDQWTL